MIGMEIHIMVVRSTLNIQISSQFIVVALKNNINCVLEFVCWLQDLCETDLSQRLKWKQLSSQHP